MPIVIDRMSQNNKKPRSQWKDRFIYTMLGLFAGMLGIHNFYLGRRFVAVLQILLSASWIWFMSKGTLIGDITAFSLFCLEIIWITAELFLVTREPDGDFMNDDARSIRLMLIFVFWFAFILLPLGFSLFVKGPAILFDPLISSGPPPEMESAEK